MLRHVNKNQSLLLFRKRRFFSENGNKFMKSESNENPDFNNNSDKLSLEDVLTNFPGFENNKKNQPSDVEEHSEQEVKGPSIIHIDPVKFIGNPIFRRNRFRMQTDETNLDSSGLDEDLHQIDYNTIEEQESTTPLFNPNDFVQKNQSFITDIDNLRKDINNVNNNNTITNEDYQKTKKSLEKGFNKKQLISYLKHNGFTASQASKKSSLVNNIIQLAWNLKISDSEFIIPIKGVNILFFKDNIKLIKKWTKLNANLQLLNNKTCFKISANNEILTKIKKEYENKLKFYKTEKINLNFIKSALPSINLNSFFNEITNYMDISIEQIDSSPVYIFSARTDSEIDKIRRILFKKVESKLRENSIFSNKLLEKELSISKIMPTYSYNTSSIKDTYTPYGRFIVESDEISKNAPTQSDYYIPSDSIYFNLEESKKRINKSIPASFLSENDERKYSVSFGQLLLSSMSSTMTNKDAISEKDSTSEKEKTLLKEIQEKITFKNNAPFLNKFIKKFPGIPSEQYVGDETNDAFSHEMCIRFIPCPFSLDESLYMHLPPVEICAQVSIHDDLKLSLGNYFYANQINSKGFVNIPLPQKSVDVQISESCTQYIGNLSDIDNVIDFLKQVIQNHTEKSSVLTVNVIDFPLDFINGVSSSSSEESCNINKEVSDSNQEDNSQYALGKKFPYRCETVELKRFRDLNYKDSCLRITYTDGGLLRGSWSDVSLIYSPKKDEDIENGFKKFLNTAYSFVDEFTDFVRKESC